MDILYQRLLESLKNLHHQFPQQRTLVVGFSGGLDSAVLLEACVRTQRTWQDWFPAGLQALHVHHGLSSNADDWLTQCEQICAAYDVPLTSVRVRLTGAASSGGSTPASLATDAMNRTTGNIEERARDARYQAYVRHVSPDAVLLLAHHQDDQAETVLLRLLRGAGERGLAGMPATRMLTSQVPLHRPLLTTSRRELEQYAAQQGLRWVDDESNTDVRFDRNFLRQQVLPLIGGRWPGWRETLTRSARLSAEADTLLREQTLFYLQDWLEPADSGQAWLSRLPCEPLQALSAGWQQRVVRAWLHEQVGQWPDEETTLRCWRLFAEVQVNAETARADGADRDGADIDGAGADGTGAEKPGAEAQADAVGPAQNSQLIPLRVVGSAEAGHPASAVALQDAVPSHVRWPQQHWGGVTFRRYRDHVYACLDDVVVPPVPAEGYPWQAGPDGRYPILMLPGNGNLRWYLVNAGGMRRPEGRCEVRYRQGGERAALAGRPRRALKKILQEAGIVPWQRDRVPLIYVDGELAWIGGVGVCERHQVADGATGWALRWQDVLPPQE